jgi:hypothetical protein|tara:strand:+ start:323 stop:562 length:240 start_codon:yes stop_codon:yes gene_type:complete
MATSTTELTHSIYFAPSSLGTVDKIIAMMRAGKSKQLYKGWNKWRDFVMEQIRKGDKQSSANSSKLQKKVSNLTKKVIR